MKTIKFKAISAPLAIISLLFIPGKEVYLGGENIGFGLKPDGVIVSDTYDLKTDSGIYNPAKNSDIKKGDIIKKIDDKTIESVYDLNDCISKLNSGSIKLELSRNDQTIERYLDIFEINGCFKTGLYVKERVLGIGTLTYYDPDTKTYGALGHEVKETYGTSHLKIESGNIYESEVIGIKKSKDGKVGEKVATLNEKNVLGDVIKNTEYGIYGHLDKPFNSKTYKLAKASDVKKGKATIYTVLDGNKKESYTIEITGLKDPSYISTKGISFKIVDKELLKKTNGIVSGMSGSPIVQGDYLIGAVTHIIIDDCDRGYGVYIEHMFKMLEE